MVGLPVIVPFGFVRQPSPRPKIKDSQHFSGAQARRASERITRQLSAFHVRLERVEILITGARHLEQRRATPYLLLDAHRTL